MCPSFHPTEAPVSQYGSGKVRNMPQDAVKLGAELGFTYGFALLQIFSANSIPCTYLQVCMEARQGPETKMAHGPFSSEAGEGAPKRASSSNLLLYQCAAHPCLPSGSRFNACSDATACCSAPWPRLAPLANALEDARAFPPKVSQDRATWDTCPALWLLLKLLNSAVVMVKQP